MRDEVEEELKRWLLHRDPPAFEGLDERSRQVYRRLVRRSLGNGVRISLPVSRALLGEELNDLIAQWMEQAPPTTRLYWRLPLEFAEWVRAQQDLPHPATAELIHWEAIKLDVRNAEPAPSNLDVESEPRPNHRVILHPSARLGIYHYPVFRMTTESPWPTASETPQFVIAYRRDEIPRWQVLAPQTAQFLAHLAQGQTVAEGYRFLEELYESLDVSPIGDHIGDLHERGAILGFRE